MRRFWSVGFAFAAALAIVGCSAQKPATAIAPGTGTAKGVTGQYFYVNLFTPPLGGIVTSDVGGIACGASSLGTPVADSNGVLQYDPVFFSGANSCGSKGQNRFDWSQKVTLTATPRGANAFISWAGDCAGSGLTCTLSAGADKTVVAVFGPPGSGHSTPFPHSDHGPAFLASVKPGAPKCTTCHGSTFAGQSIAPSCNACHATAGHPDWRNECTFCHGAPPTLPTHPGVPADLPGCAVCHPDTVTSTGTIVPSGKHMDGAIQFTGHAAGYGAPSVHGPAYFGFLGNVPATLDCTNCHGQTYAGAAGIPSCNGCHAQAGWANWQQSCSFCHGLANATTKAGYDFALHPEWAAPPSDVNGRVYGTNGPAVGAHQAHVATNVVRSAIACSECHVVPAAAIHTLNHQLDLPFGPLSKSGGAVPTWDAATLTCGSNYCHGNFNYSGVRGNAASLTWNTTQIGCTTCHDMPPAGHIPVGTAPSVCSGCHPDTVLANGSIDLAKGRHINGQKDVTGGACDSCHWFPYPSAVPPVTPYPASGAHLAHYALTSQGSTGYGDLQVLEQKFPTPPPPTSGYAFGCGNCHPSVSSEHSMLTGGNSAKVVLFETIVQSPAVKSKNDSTASFNPASRTCSGVYCHEKVGATPAWNSGAALPCNACHGSSADPGGAPTGDSHVLHGYSCTTCHAATTANGTTIANTALHVNGRPDVAQGPGATFTYASGGTCSNISCHFGASATWGTKQSGHLATLGTGEVLVFAQANTDHGANFTIPENCASCHSPSLVAQHAGKCEICHAGTNPASGLIGSWSKGCSAGACHSTIHDGGLGADHFMMWQNSSAACDRCHDGVGGFPGSGDNCSRCHNPGLTAAAVGDHQPPTTTSDAASTYVGAGTIHLAATDAGTSGVSVTWFSLDGHEWTLGTDVVFGAPTTGSRPHTLQFYSVDHALNAEVVKTVAFTVQALADGTPPSTTSSFNPAAGAVFTASQPVALTASDNASGVKATYYRIDAGAFIQGASFTVTDGLHTFSYYSVDNANNTETTHVSNSFRVDTIAPATTSTAVNGSAYTGPQTFTLSASDAGSGVASTWYKLDGAVFTQGTSISVPAPASGSASHTLSWYSLDVAGNQEVTRSVTFTVQLPVADSTAPTTTSSFNPAAGAVFNANRQVTLLATDNAGGSGVRATYYRIDGGAYVQSTSFTVTEGVHTFSYYSVDNANNTETAHVSNSFRVDMIAPVTTSTATNGTTYTGPQTFTLAATDTNGSGVASTWYTLDGGALTSGTVISIAAPASGSASHTITWYSVDLAGNQEATRSVTFAIAAPVTGGTTHISFRTSCDVYGNGWYGVTWQIRNAVGTVIEEFWNDDCGHPSSAMWADYDVPSGAAYELYGEFWDMDVDAAVDSATRAVSPAEASPDATIEWWFH